MKTIKTITTAVEEDQLLKKIDNNYNAYIKRGVEYIKDNDVNDCYYLIKSSEPVIPSENAVVDYFVSKLGSSDNKIILKKDCSNCKNYNLEKKECNVGLKPEYKYGKLICQSYIQRLQNTSMFNSDNNRKPCGYYIGKYGVDYSVYLAHQTLLWKRMKIDLPIIVLITVIINFFVMYLFIKKIDNKIFDYKKEAYIEAVRDYNKGTLKAKLIKNADGTTSWIYIEDND